MEINLSFLFKAIFYMTKTTEQKFKYLKYKKRFLGEIKNIFHHFLEGFQLPLIVSDLWVGLQVMDDQWLLQWNASYKFFAFAQIALPSSTI